MLGVDAFSPCALEETQPSLFWYGIHGCEMLFTAMGPGCATVSRTQTEDTDVCVASAPAWAPPRLRTAKAADLADAWDAYQRAAGLKGADAAERAVAPVDSPPPSPTKAKRKKKKKKGAKATS